ncbi:CBS domain-containing protein [Antarcticibacterium sp. 1MA-6-2]|uniref:CBS domain-containing protein n=1 Tax=Antarcticibacterium sp. 1MA-6-2 TaxID=2908210 RepID=UPI001F43D3DC|nr:CBS domain-containing protein [Antarcticibacterium sp. 1MA-6-2]UJH90492.1 CBS domain-containing protein [Antarcticibacterium sp. 1MA-6-2]
MGIKSFQGRRAEPEKLESAPILVEHYMTTSLITFSKDQLVIEVMEALVKNKISGAPVVNERMELVGIISDGDCMKQISECRYYNMPIGDKRIEEFMESNVYTIDKKINIFDCASLFYKHGYRRFPIVENGRLIGQISRKDILCAAMKLRGQNWHC